METLEALSKRVNTVREMQSLVHTMRTLSAVNIRQFEGAAFALYAFQEVIEMGIRAMRDWLVPRWESAETLSTIPALIAIGAERGLCGRYSDKISRQARDWQDTVQLTDNFVPPILGIGSKLITALHTEGVSISDELRLPSSTHALGTLTGQIIEMIDDWRLKQGVESVDIMHMRRVPAGHLKLQISRIWPIEANYISKIFNRPWPSRRLPVWQGPPEDIASSLLRQLLAARFTRACLEAMIAESAARLSTMQAAEINIVEHLDGLEQTRHRRRQEAITSELMETMSGFDLTMKDY
jgi:F-type H+-transporting ATPase subunit gamma